MLFEMLFKVGDRIRVIKTIAGCDQRIKPNMEGTVVVVEKGTIGVDFDSDIGGHGCDGHSRRCHGWWLFGYDYEFIENITNQHAVTINVSDYL